MATIQYGNPGFSAARRRAEETGRWDEDAWFLKEFPLAKEIHFQGGTMKCGADGQRDGGAGAHANSGDRHICVFDESGGWSADYPSTTFLHEYAHLQTPSDDVHGAEWLKQYEVNLARWGYRPAPGTKLTGMMGEPLELIALRPKDAPEDWQPNPYLPNPPDLLRPGLTFGGGISAKDAGMYGMGGPAAELQGLPQIPAYGYAVDTAEAENFVGAERVYSAIGRQRIAPEDRDYGFIEIQAPDWFDRAICENPAGQDGKGGVYDKLADPLVTANEMLAPYGMWVERDDFDAPCRIYAKYDIAASAPGHIRLPDEVVDWFAPEGMKRRLLAAQAGRAAQATRRLPTESQGMLTGEAGKLERGVLEAIADCRLTQQGMDKQARDLELEHDEELAAEYNRAAKYSRLYGLPYLGQPGYAYGLTARYTPTSRGPGIFVQPKVGSGAKAGELKQGETQWRKWNELSPAVQDEVLKDYSEASKKLAGTKKTEGRKKLAKLEKERAQVDQACEKARASLQELRARELIAEPAGLAIGLAGELYEGRMRWAAQRRLEAEREPVARGPVQPGAGTPEVMARLTEIEVETAPLLALKELPPRQPKLAQARMMGPDERAVMAREMAEKSGKHISVMGGEPTMPELLAEIDRVIRALEKDVAEGAKKAATEKAAGKRRSAALGVTANRRRLAKERRLRTALKEILDPPPVAEVAVVETPPVAVKPEQGTLGWGTPEAGLPRERKAVSRPRGGRRKEKGQQGALLLARRR